MKMPAQICARINFGFVCPQSERDGFAFDWLRRVQEEKRKQRQGFGGCRKFEWSGVVEVRLVEQVNAKHEILAGSDFARRQVHYTGLGLG